jgi:hypothetical protein
MGGETAAVIATGFGTSFVDGRLFTLISFEAWRETCCVDMVGFAQGDRPLTIFGLTALCREGIPKADKTIGR